MKKCILVLCVLCLPGMIMADKAITMTDLIKPDSISVDDGQIYVTDDIVILIYDLKNFTLKKRFGKEGEGPGEFIRNRQTGNPPLSIDVQTENLIVNSMNKISIFSKQGQFIEERKVLDRGDQFKPLGKGFAGQGDMREGTVRYITVNIYDSELRKVNQVYKVPHPVQRIGRGFKVINEPRVVTTYRNQLFVTLDRDFIIRVFNFRGVLLYQIDREYTKRKITDEVKRRVDEYLKNHPRIKELYELIKPLIFPEYYPAIRSMNVSDNRIYVVTWNQKEETTECDILDIYGKRLKHVFLPIRYIDELEIYPFTFKNNRLYQLVENEDEEWELHITEINRSGAGPGT